MRFGRTDCLVSNLIDFNPYGVNLTANFSAIIVNRYEVITSNFNKLEEITYGK